jgi:predicted PurR-regulated permease PerM
MADNAATPIGDEGDIIAPAGGPDMSDAGSDDSLLPARFAPWQRVRPGTLSFGVNSWLFLGTVAALAFVVWVLVQASGITVPLLIGAVLGVLFYPLVDSMAKYRIPRSIGATLVILLLFAIVGFTVYITVAGIINEGDEIVAGIEEGIASIGVSLSAYLGTTSDDLQYFVNDAWESAQGRSSELVSGGLSNVAAAVGSGLSGILGAFFGLFIGTTILYYLLSDWHTVEEWLGGHLGVPPAIGEGVVQDATDSIRGYFKGTTLSGIAVAVVIGVAMWLLGVPLAFSVAIVTFLTCYIPYFGAIISGAFAFLVALGTTDFQTAMIVLIVVLVAQNLLQTVISNQTMGSALDLHPLVVLIVTILGGTFAGILGTAFAAPFTAMAVRISNRLQAAAAEPEGLIPAETQAAPEQTQT